jgi:Leucine-rich repeat (LRR) protein
MIKKILLFGLNLLFIFSTQAQKLSTEEVKQYTEECHDLVAYLEFSLNAIGDNELTPKEKDIIISESYLKLFRDDKVQIEDDLVPEREAVTNKDVQAYLKDVDFFFNRVNFSYKILSTNLQQDENDHEFFKIHALRTISGHNLNGDSIYNEQARYIEVTIDADLRDLKIVSVYTTKINEKEENIKWWNELPISWKEILGKKTSLCDPFEFSNLLAIEPDFLVLESPFDSINPLNSQYDNCDSLGLFTDSGKIDTLHFTNDSLKQHFSKLIENGLIRIINKKELDISGRLDITHVEPLNKLSELTTLNISGTLVEDLYPVRNLVHLQDLNISSTLVSKLDALVYSMSLQNLNLSHSKVYSLEPLSNLTQVKTLNISNTSIDDLTPISEFHQLSELRMQNTMVYSLEAVSQLESLDFIYFDNSPINQLEYLSALSELRIISANNTMINDLTPLHKLNELNVLYCDNTEITSLKALDGKEKLSKVYCDNTLLGKKKALDFMSRNPNVLVVYESRKLQKWFENLSDNWKMIFKKHVPTIDLNEPGKEDLHQVAGIAKMDLSSYPELKSIEPLYHVQNLQELNISHTNVESIEALYELRELKYLNISYSKVRSISSLENNNSLKEIDLSHTKVQDLTPLKDMFSLRRLNIENSPVKDLDPILTLSGMKELRADKTQISIQQFQSFILANPNCLVIYQSDELENWWNSLESIWKQEFSQMQNWNRIPNNDELHQLLARTHIKIENNRNIKSLKEINGFLLLENLELSGTQVMDITEIGSFKRLKKLNLSDNPIADFAVIGQLKNLEWMNISNTQVENLDWISGLTNLQYLDISGTPVKKLKPLQSLRHLESLIAFNTRVNSLKDIEGLEALKSLKIYNTKVSSKKVEQFKFAHPNCQVDYF